MSAPNVIVADTHELSVAGLLYLVHQAFETAQVETVKSRVALSNVLKNFPSGILIVNPYGVKDLDPASLLKVLTDNSQVYPLLLVSRIDQEDLKPLIKFGAIGIITKNCSQREVLAALEAAIHQEKFVCNKVMEAFLAVNEAADDLQSEKTLSEREIGVIRFIAKGMSTEQIGEELHLSPHTIHAHRKNILKKMNVKTPVELVVKAIREKLITV
ncbi:response regulator transcription factor [uncultured Imperialibacter sp.]|uniref:helix-turn-helix transcriptional regulator n=1 Tax=uncultured Imperialibacter sp. TaxID=1672639 RepID=UPI0030D9AACE|tara:strand:+ start:154 stop:795 length:642 start_codon:yes stop_codon:yes gene_type:complete